MSIFQFSDGSFLDPNLNDKILTSVLVREPDRLDELPENYQVIDQSMLDFQEEGDNGYIDANGYFHGEGVANGGQAIALLNDDGTISIAFRGTNDSIDLLAVTQFDDNDYIYGFEDWLQSVANFASNHDYTIDLVTGKSLGGAATNMLFEEAATLAGGAYADASFVGVASPLVSDHSGKILNFGYENDYAFEWYEERFGNGGGDFESALDNVVYYNSEYAASNWSSWLDFSAHSYNAFENGFEAIANSEFADEMEQDDLVVIAHDTSVRVDVALNRTEPDADETYVLAGRNADFDIRATRLDDHIEMAAGDDTIRAYHGDDEIYGGDGRDFIIGGSGEDIIYGDGGYDSIRAGNHDDLVYGGGGFDSIRGSNGNDELYGGGGKDVIHGGNHDDQIYGGDWHDKLYGGKGNDYLSGGQGNDILTGHKGEDIFAYEAGHDIIRDFNIGEDHLEIKFDALADFKIEDHIELDRRGHVKINFDDENSLLLRGVTLEEFETFMDEAEVEDLESIVFI